MTTLEILKDLRKKINDIREEYYNTLCPDYVAYAELKRCVDIVDETIKEVKNNE